MSTLAQVLSGLCLVGGGLFVIVGSLGLLRLPDFYTRMHAAGITDTLGAGLVVLGLAIQAGFTLACFKLFLLLSLLIFTSPCATHALAKAARHGAVRPLLARAGDDR